MHIKQSCDDRIRLRRQGITETPKRILLEAKPANSDEISLHQRDSLSIKMYIRVCYFRTGNHSVVAA